MQKLILGSVQFGLNYGINNTSGKPSFKEVNKILEFALSKGIRTIDTAFVYGDAIEKIGLFIKRHPGEISINSKFHMAYGAKSITNQLHESLKKLNVDFVNTYFYHNFDDVRNFPDGILELCELKRRGLIKYIGVSIYNNEDFLSLISLKEIDVIQLPFNLLDNSSQRGHLIKQAKAEKKSIQVRSVFLQGLFFKPFDEFPENLKQLIAPIQQLHVLTKRFNVSMNQLALSYALSKEYIDGVVLGVDNVQQLESNIDYVDLPDELVRAVDEIKIDSYQLLNPTTWNIKK